MSTIIKIIRPCNFEKNIEMLENQKHLFSLDKGVHYLNCAYKAPLLKSAENAAISSLIKQRNPAQILPKDYFEEAEEVRSLFGKIVNCKPSEVAIIPSTSYGFSSVLNNISCKRGQHAITIESEFPSDYFSIEAWCKKHNAPLKIIKANKELPQQGAEWNRNILESISDKTAVVILSSVHWMSGLRFDLKKIGEQCRKVGAKFIVDGTQSVGAMHMNVKEYQIDALVCASYKWLFGPYSVALAYIGETFNDGTPLEETWMNRINARDFGNLTDYNQTYTQDAGRYNVGQFSNLILMPMLIESLKQINLWTVDAIQAYCKKLAAPLINYLQNLGMPLEEEAYFSNHLFSLALPKTIDFDSFQEKINERNIIISIRKGNLRISINVFNTEEDIQQLIEVIEDERT